MGDSHHLRVPAPPPLPGFWASVWARYRKRPLGVAGLAAAFSMLLVAFLAPLLGGGQPILCRYRGALYAPALVETIQKVPLAAYVVEKDRPFRLASFDFKAAFDPGQGDWALWPLVPFGPEEIDREARPLEPPSRRHWLGTDEVGRDVLARMIHGTSVSMKVGFISMGIAALLGVVLGGLAGYCGRWADIVISRLIEIVMCFPTLFLILAVLAWLPPRIENVMVVIGLTRWVTVARYTRGEFLRLRELDYAVAARALGAGAGRIIFRHLLPNALAPVLVSVTFGVANAILVESALSWLGFGVQEPQPSWGNILRSGYEHVISAPHLVLPACVAIFLAVLAFNLVGDTLRDVVDPRTRRGPRRP